MALPPECKRVSKGQQAIAGPSASKQQNDTPHFVIYIDLFLEILGPQPSIELAIEQDWPFAHEAGVYIPIQDAVYITSNRLAHGIKISKISRGENGRWTSEELQTDVEMGNGGINYRGGVLFCAQGSKSSPSGLVLMSTEAPYTTETVLDNYYGRSFNSLNDVVIHTDGSIWFTDPIYGYEQGFKGEPQLPCQVYRFDPETGDVRVVADGLSRPNGLCFSPDESTLYITDTDWVHGDGTTDDTRARTIYAFDVVERHSSHFLADKRLFAMAHTGIPDGIKCDMQGNVYSGCGDGVNVWTPGGMIIGKIVCPGGVANFSFARKGEMVLFNETRLYTVKISENVEGALLKNMSIGV